MSEAKFLSLAEAAKAFPKIDGRHPHIASVWRARSKGLLARSGKRVKLESVRVGRRIAIPEGAVEHFLRELAAEDMKHFDAPTTPMPPPQPATKASDALRRKQIEAAEAVCRKAGLK